MSSAPPPLEPDRFGPHAARQMAEMFDDVSERYDLLNRIMTLGRDSAWRAAMADQVPEDARVVLDLCTGSGASLAGLRRPGRLVVGLDVSLRMLARARQGEGRAGWAPRLVAGDAFRLPLRDASVDCVTVAFGVRNLRPRGDALAELARVLKPGGRLVVLEAAAPSPGCLAPFHRAYLARVLPWLGRLSPDPSAYAYLGRSILEFGAAEGFDHALARGGFTLERRRRFLLGATHLWTAGRAGGDDPPAGRAALQPAREREPTRGRMPTAAARRAAEYRFWTTAQLAVSMLILVVLALARRSFRDVAPGLSIEPWNRRAMEMVLLVGLVGFAVRSVVLLVRLFGAPPRS